MAVQGERKVLMEWESFGMIDSRKQSQIEKYRRMADSVQIGEKSVKFSYQYSGEIDLSSKPSVASVLLEQNYFGYIDEGFKIHPLWGYCQNCASGRIAKATHTVSERMGHTTIRCGACGETGSVRFFVNNENEYGWVNDRYSWEDAPKYRITSATNRCFSPSYRGIDEFFEIKQSVPHKRRRSIISVDHRPQTWVKESGTAAGLFLTEDARNSWLEEDYNPHDEIDFSKSEFRTPDESIVVR